MADSLIATFRIVTPMFIGGADQSPNDGIRPPSFKGALRFWWRALNWGKYYQQENKNEVNAMIALHANEAQLFGLAADGKGGGGQGRFLLSIQHDVLAAINTGQVHQNFKPTKTKMRAGRPVVDENHLAAARYLGYGLMTAFTSRDRDTRAINKHAGQLDRGCLNEDQTFIVTLTFRDKVDNSILNSLKALGLLGGLGSRSRHGMGSIALDKIIASDQKSSQREEIWTAPTSQKQYKSKINELIGSLASIPQPKYSAFSKDSRIDCLLSANSPYEVLNEFGMNMLDYRSWGQSKNGNVLPSGNVSEMRFQDDHHWFRNAITFRPANPDFHPKRVVFGLPHNYDSRKKEHTVNAATHERRASPLFFHVHRLSDKEYIGASVLLQSRFLPDTEKINAGGNPVDQNIDWTVITNFLDGKVADTPATPKPTAPARFPGKYPVLP